MTYLEIAINIVLILCISILIVIIYLSRKRETFITDVKPYELTDKAWDERYMMWAIWDKTKSNFDKINNLLNSPDGNLKKNTINNRIKLWDDYKLFTNDQKKKFSLAYIDNWQSFQNHIQTSKVNNQIVSKKLTYNCQSTNDIPVTLNGKTTIYKEREFCDQNSSMQYMYLHPAFTIDSQAVTSMSPIDIMSYGYITYYGPVNVTTPPPTQTFTVFESNVGSEPIKVPENVIAKLSPITNIQSGNIDITTVKKDFFPDLTASWIWNRPSVNTQIGEPPKPVIFLYKFIYNGPQTSAAFVYSAKGMIDAKINIYSTTTDSKSKIMTDIKQLEFIQALYVELKNDTVYEVIVTVNPATDPTKSGFIGTMMYNKFSKVIFNTDINKYKWKIL